MTKWLLALAVALGGFAVVSADDKPMAGHDHHDMHHEMKMDAKADAAATPAAGEILGEVLDLNCYMGHGTKGKDHAKCGNACVKGGSSAGILTNDGQVYLLLEDHANTKPYKAIHGMVGEQAKVKGNVVKQPGVQAILVANVEKAK